MKFKVGDLVAKNPKTWIPSAFDAWGRGTGHGIVLEVLEEGLVDVRWPGGKSYEHTIQLLPKVIGE